MGSGGKDKEKEPKQRKKPGRVPTSCAECRRLKLRCDRNVPCEKCVSRGCGSICPDGALTSGKGGRLILANTEELHDRIEQMSARNRELEGALRKLQESFSDQPHPLLTSELRLNTTSSGPSTSSSSKSPSASASAPRTSPTTRAHNSQEFKFEEDHGSGINNFGTLTVNRRGGFNFLGRTARSEYLAQVTTTASHKSSSRTSFNAPRFSRRIREVAFPEAELYDDALLSDVLNLLPSQNEAQHLCEVYLEYGRFMYSSISKKELLEETLPQVYRAKQYGGFFEHYHALSLLCIVFALGMLFSPHQQAYSNGAREYYYLAKVSLGFLPPIQETTLNAIQVLVHMAHFLELSDMDADTSGDGGKSYETAWMYIGQAVRLGQKIGLHLNNAHWKLPEEAVHRRHDLFWRLFVSDTWISLHLGRPPALSGSQYDCPRPLPMDSADAGSFTLWNAHFTALVHEILEGAMGPKQPVYASILESDLRIRNFHVPASWRMMMHDEKERSGDSTVQEVHMFRWLVLSTKEMALLNLHRTYFAQLVQESPSDIQRHPYFASILATYRAAWRIIHGLTMTWSILPKFLSRVKSAWSHGFSAAVVMCSLATLSPASHLSKAALEDLENLTSLFNSSASECQPAALLLPAIQNLRRKAYDVLGLPSTRFHQHDEAPLISFQELDRLNGRTYLYAENHDGSSSAFASSWSMEPLSQSRATSVTMSDVVESHHDHQQQTSSLENLHPVLAQDMREFRTSHVSYELTFYDYPCDPPSFPSSSRTQPLPPSGSSAPMAAAASDGAGHSSRLSRSIQDSHSSPEPSRLPHPSTSYHQQQQPPVASTAAAAQQPIQPPPRIDSFQAPFSVSQHPDPVHSSSSSLSSSPSSIPNAFQHDTYNDHFNPRATASTTVMSSANNTSSTSTSSSFPSWSTSTSNINSFSFQSGFSSGGGFGIGGFGFGIANTSSPSGFGILGGGIGGGFASSASSFPLDSSWNNFIEQIGF